jgi:hypothetical protein
LDADEKAGGAFLVALADGFERPLSRPDARACCSRPGLGDGRSPPAARELARGKVLAVQTLRPNRGRGGGGVLVFGVMVDNDKI